jgi:two-component sensor histidine kinase
VFDKYNVDKIWRGRFVLITDELVNNAIEHGSTVGDLDSCIIHASEDEHRDFSIILEVHDTGRGKDSKDATHMEDIKNKKLQEHNEE